MRVGTNTVPMTPQIKNNILEHVKEYGTGSDTLRCLGLGTIDKPPSPESMDLSDSSKFADYEVIYLRFAVGLCICA